MIKIEIEILEKKIHIDCPGNRLGIIGPSGSGKSTLAKIMIGIQTIKGEIHFKNKMINDLPAWKRKFSYMPQDFQLLPHLNVEENILFPLYANFNHEIIQILELNPLLKRMPRNLSGGEKQRVALARALSTSSDLIILDEPFSYLDLKLKEKILNFVNEFTKNKPLMIITHNLDEINFLNCQIQYF